MRNPDPIGILVGVDGSRGSDSAVRYGALEAQRLEAPLTLLHVVSDNVALAPMAPVIPDDVTGFGRRVLANARAKADLMTQGLNVQTMVRPGSVSAELVAAGSTALEVILGRNIGRRSHRTFNRAVTSWVAGHTAAPVVSVPDSWDPDPWCREVVVGVRDKHDAADTLERAFDTAEARGDRLTVFHAWEPPNIPDDIGRSTPDGDWKVRELEGVEARLEDLRADHPGVPLDVSVVDAQPARALVDASVRADLLVLGRRQRCGPANPTLEGTTRAVLGEASCAVEVVPFTKATEEMAGLELERAGVPLK